MQNSNEIFEVSTRADRLPMGFPDEGWFPQDLEPCAQVLTEIPTPGSDRNAPCPAPPRRLHALSVSHSESFSLPFLKKVWRFCVGALNSPFRRFPARAVMQNCQIAGHEHK